MSTNEELGVTDSSHKCHNLAHHTLLPKDNLCVSKPFQQLSQDDVDASGERTHRLYRNRYVPGIKVWKQSFCLLKKTKHQQSLCFTLIFSEITNRASFEH